MAAPNRPRTRRIGTFGTIARVAVGSALVIVPIALGGIAWLDMAAFALFTAIATATAIVISTGLPRARLGIAPGCVLCGALLAEAVGLGAAMPANLNVVVGSFLGISMLLAAARGDSGCELVTIPNAITGRRDRIGCVLFGPIDAADARRQS